MNTVNCTSEECSGSVKIRKQFPKGGGCHFVEGHVSRLLRIVIELDSNNAAVVESDKQYMPHARSIPKKCIMGRRTSSQSHKNV